MVISLSDFFSGLLVEFIGFALTSITVYLIFQRRETKKLELLKKTVYIRLKNKIFNRFITETIQNMRSDIVKPSAYTSLLASAPIASSIIKIEELQEKKLESFRKRDIKSSISLRDEQWKLIISDDFLIIVKMIVGQWSSKQWKKHFLLLGQSLKQIRELLDLYQSRLPADIVCKLIEYENKIEAVMDTVAIFPEYFSRIDELTIPITSEFLANRRSFLQITCENIFSIFKYIDELQEELK